MVGFLTRCEAGINLSQGKHHLGKMRIIRLDGEPWNTAKSDSGIWVSLNRDETEALQMELLKPLDFMQLQGHRVPEQMCVFPCFSSR